MPEKRQMKCADYFPAAPKRMDIKIRPWQASDAADLTAAINNKKVLDNLRDGIPFPYTEKDGTEFITAMLGAAPESTYAFAITVDGRAIGSIGVFRQGNIHSRTGELGYYIGEPYWGKGIVTEAAKQICSIIFESTDIIRIFAEPFAFNIASCRVLERAGFQFEGTLRQNAIKNGKIIDMKMYALVKRTNEIGIRLIASDEIIRLEDFLYLAIFVPAGATPPPRDVLCAPRIAAYIDGFGKPDDACFVAVKGEQIVGAAWSRILSAPDKRGYGNIDGHTPELAVSVLPEYRDKGIGGRLIISLHDELGTRGYSQISLSVQKENPAFRLYERTGYKIVKENAEDYIMVKELVIDNDEEKQ